MGILTDVKNAAVKLFLANALKDFGELKDLNIDSPNKALDIDFLPIGESENINLNISKYEIILEDNRTYFIPREFKCSKLWLDRIGNKFLVGNKFELPSEYSKIISSLL